MNCLLPLGQGVDRSDGGRPETDFRGRHLRRTHESGHLGSAMTTLLPSTPGGGDRCRRLGIRREIWRVDPVGSDGPSSLFLPAPGVSPTSARISG